MAVTNDSSNSCYHDQFISIIIQTTKSDTIRRSNNRSKKSSRAGVVIKTTEIENKIHIIPSTKQEINDMVLIQSKVSNGIDAAN